MNSRIRIALILSFSQLGSSCVDDNANREIDQAQIAREIARDPELFQSRVIRPLRDTQEPDGPDKQKAEQDGAHQPATRPAPDAE